MHSSPRFHLTHVPAHFLLSLEYVFLLHWQYLCSILSLFYSHCFFEFFFFFQWFLPTNLPVNLAVVHRFNLSWDLQISIWFPFPVTTNICLWIVLLIIDSRTAVVLFCCTALGFYDCCNNSVQWDWGQVVTGPHSTPYEGENSSILILLVSNCFFFFGFYKEDIVSEVEKYNWSTVNLK